MSFKLENFLPLPWNEYFKLINNRLVDQILESGEKYDRIVGISRCGLILGRILSDMLEVPVSIFTIKSYTGVNQQGEVKITEELPADIRGEKILLVDGLADSGRTFVKAIEYLKTKNPAKITTAAVFHKPHSIYKPDFFARTTPKWVLFPYEFTENAILLKNLILKEKGDARSTLMKLGYTKEDLDLLEKRKVL